VLSHMKKTNILHQFVIAGTERTIVIRSLKTSIFVGTILALINHGDKLMGGIPDTGVIIKIITSYAVPYTVSTWASVMAAKSKSLTYKKQAEI